MQFELENDVPVAKVQINEDIFEVSAANHRLLSLEDIACQAMEQPGVLEWIESQGSDSALPTQLVYISDERSPKYVLLEYLRGNSNEHWISHQDVSGILNSYMQYALDHSTDYSLVFDGNLQLLNAFGEAHGFHGSNQDVAVFTGAMSGQFQAINEAVRSGLWEPRYAESLQLSLHQVDLVELDVTVDVIVDQYGNPIGYFVGADFLNLNQIKERFPVGRRFEMFLRLIPTPVLAYKYSGELDNQRTNLFVVNGAMRELMALDQDSPEGEIELNIAQMFKFLDPTYVDENGDQIDINILVQQISGRLELLRAGPTVLTPITIPLDIDGNKVVLVNFPMSIQDVNGELYIMNFFLDNTYKQDIVKLSNLISESISQITHDLNTPLAVFDQYIYLLRNRMTALSITDEKVVKYLETLALASHTMQKTIYASGVISRARIHNEIQRTTFDISPEINDICDMWETEADKRGIELVNNINQLSISSNSEALRLVFENLISNAMHYTSSGGRISIDYEYDNEGSIIFSITDNGIGIPQSDLQVIFEKSFRSQSARVSRPQGTGLGLNTVKNIVTLLDGQVWAESSLPDDPKNGVRYGSAFYVKLPL